MSRELYAIFNKYLHYNNLQMLFVNFQMSPDYLNECA